MNISEAQARLIADGSLKNIGKAEGTFNLPYDSVLEEIFEVWGNQYIDTVRAFLTKNKLLASRNLLQSVGFDVVVRGNNLVRFTLYMPPYWKWVDQGRKPGKRPPIKPIMEWIAHKGIPVRTSAKQSGKSVLEASRSLAISIAWAIAKKGTIKRFGHKGSDLIKATLPPHELEKLSTALTAASGQLININLKF